MKPGRPSSSGLFYVQAKTLRWHWEGLLSALVGGHRVLSDFVDQALDIFESFFFSEEEVVSNDFTADDVPGAF